MIYLIAFILGACFGSFLSVIYKRFNPEKPLFKKDIFFSRSRCPYCLHTLSFYELVPLVSFFIQGGRCRHCHKKISWEYPLLEIITGLLAMASLKFYMPAKPLSWLAVISIFFIFFFLFLASLIDIKYLLIPEEILIILFVLGIFLIAIQSFLGFNSYIGYFKFTLPRFNLDILNHLLGGLVGFVFLGSLAFFSKERIMGWGDVQLGTVLGFIINWPGFILTLLIAFIFGGLCALPLLVIKIKKKRDYLAFIPFLSLGTFLTVIYGFKIIQIYFKIFKIG